MRIRLCKRKHYEVMSHPPPEIQRWRSNQKNKVGVFQLDIALANKLGEPSLLLKVFAGHYHRTVVRKKKSLSEALSTEIPLAKIL